MLRSLKEHERTMCSELKRKWCPTLLETTKTILFWLKTTILKWRRVRCDKLPFSKIGVDHFVLTKGCHSSLHSSVINIICALLPLETRMSVMRKIGLVSPLLRLECLSWVRSALSYPLETRMSVMSKICTLLPLLRLECLSLARSAHFYPSWD